jgi:hypothetical protein
MADYRGHDGHGGSQPHQAEPEQERGDWGDRRAPVPIFYKLRCWCKCKWKWK